MHRRLRATVALIAGVAMTFVATMAAELPASAASRCDITFSKYRGVKAGSRGAQAKAAQCLLRSAGHSVKTDGTFSGSDADRLRSFQRAHRLSRSGSVDRPTWTALLSRGSRPSLRVGDSGTAVKRLQRSLTASGRSVQVTGYFGPRTQSAVRSVQRYQGWRQTGAARTGVWKALQAGGQVQVRTSPARKKTNRTRVSSSTKGRKALAFARRQLGDPYRYGATGPGAWDCSGLTGGAWRSAGVRLPRTALAQYHSGGRRVSKSNLRKGDLVFFYSGISHVAIYAGGGKVVHASRPGKPVNTLPMKYMPYRGAVRPA
jgi:cell wall-associated NlpC family hydrolase